MSTKKASPRPSNACERGGKAAVVVADIINREEVGVMVERSWPSVNVEEG